MDLFLIQLVSKGEMTLGYDFRKISYLSIIFYHDVTVVAITNAQYKGSNAVARTGSCKQVNSCIIPIEKGDVDLQIF